MNIPPPMDTAYATFWAITIILVLIALHIYNRSCK